MLYDIEYRVRPFAYQASSPQFHKSNSCTVESEDEKGEEAEAGKHQSLYRKPQVGPSTLENHHYRIQMMKPLDSHLANAVDRADGEDIR